MQSTCCALLQDTELMPQNQSFGFQPPSRLEAVVQQADEKEGNCNHSAIMFWFGADRESNGLSFWKRQARMCGPWLILVPFAGMLAAFLIYDSDWRRPRKTELEGWMHLGLFAGFAMMFILMWAFCAKSAN
jgi:hypothetical protein